MSLMTPHSMSLVTPHRVSLMTPHRVSLMTPHRVSLTTPHHVSLMTPHRMSLMTPRPKLQCTPPRITWRRGQYFQAWPPETYDESLTASCPAAALPSYTMHTTPHWLGWDNPCAPPCSALGASVRVCPT